LHSMENPSKAMRILKLQLWRAAYGRFGVAVNGARHRRWRANMTEHEARLALERVDPGSPTRPCGLCCGLATARLGAADRT
jgi:hypothetical protein